MEQMRIRSYLLMFIASVIKLNDTTQLKLGFNGSWTELGCNKGKAWSNAALLYIYITNITQFYVSC